MIKNDLDRIKNKFQFLNANRYWGDDYDVRYYLISKFTQIKNKTILDIGGGVGVISSELDESNNCINLDISFNDLTQCKNLFKNSIHVLNGSMTNLCLKDNSFDIVICSNILEVAKLIDIQTNSVIKNKINEFPNVSKVLDEIKRVLIPGGVLLLTTPNNQYYKSNKLSYDELKFHLEMIFKDYSLELYNTYPQIYSKNRKLNMANILPKIMSKFLNRKKIIEKKLVSFDNKIKKNSVSFFVEIKNKY